MSILNSEVKQQKLVGMIAKLAIMIVSAPATISIAKKAYADVEGIAQVVVVAACVMLVEAAFLWFWIKVNGVKSNVSRDEQTQSGAIAGVWIMYFVLLLVGVLHGEGMLALIFRASMGLLIFMDTRDKLLLTKAKIEERFANGEYFNRKLVSTQRKADEEVALKRIRKDKDIRLDMIKQDADGLLVKQAASSFQAMLNEHELTIPKASVSKSVDGPLETAFYVIKPVDDSYELQCRHCDYVTLWPSRMQAARSGNAHSKMHKNGHRKFVAKEFVKEA